MKTGFSKICINPPYNVPISGYYEERRVKGILDNLYVRATAFELILNLIFAIYCG